MSLKDECKEHFLEYNKLIIAKDWEGINNKLMEDRKRDVKDLVRTLNLQKSALVITEGIEEVKKEYDKTVKIFNIHKIFGNES